MFLHMDFQQNMYVCGCPAATNALSLHLLPFSAAGVRLVIELKRGFSHELVLNQLYNSTRLQLKFAANMVSMLLSAVSN